jgi:hypothetical protein
MATLPGAPWGCSDPLMDFVADQDVTLLEMPDGRGQRRESVRWDVLDRDFCLVGTLTPNKDEVPSATVDISSDVARSISDLWILDSDYQELDPFNNLIRPVWCLEDNTQWPLSCFYITGTSKKRRTSVGTHRRLALDDSTWPLLAKRRDAFGLTGGKSIALAIAQLFDECGIAYYDIATNTSEVGEPGVSWPIGTPRIEMVRALCGMAGMYRPAAQNNGEVLVSQAQNLENISATLRYPLTGSRVIADSLDDQTNPFSAPNVYVVVSGNSGASIAAAANVTADAPHSVASRGLEIVEVITLDGLSTQQAARTAIEAAAGQRATDYSTIEFDSVPDPRHGVFEVLDVDGVIYREVSHTLPLSHGSAHHHVCNQAYTLVEDNS